MEKINQFSIGRLALLVKRSFYMNQKSFLISLASLAGTLLTISLLNTYTNNGFFSLDSIVQTGLVTIFIAGYIMSSMAFKELNTPAKGQFYLLLPAKSIEKVTAAWLLTAIGYSIVALLSLSLISGLASLVNHLIFKSQLNMLNPFTPTILKYMAGYVVTQSVFLFGAVYFRKNNFLKTVLGMFVVNVIMGAWMALLVWIFFAQGNQYIGPETFADPIRMEAIVRWGSQIAFWGILMPFFFTLSYYTLKEREV